VFDPDWDELAAVVVAKKRMSAKARRRARDAALLLGAAAVPFGARAMGRTGGKVAQRLNEKQVVWQATREARKAARRDRRGKSGSGDVRKSVAGKRRRTRVGVAAGSVAFGVGAAALARRHMASNPSEVDTPGWSRPSYSLPAGERAGGRPEVGRVPVAGPGSGRGTRVPVARPGSGGAVRIPLARPGGGSKGRVVRGRHIGRANKRAVLASIATL
jgi:hypothetical protein